jgi:cytochrome c-type biogenesis protein CcmH
MPTRGQYDQAVYRDQLQEVDRDVARGVLTSEEAQSARLEIQRRLLAADADLAPVPPDASGPAGPGRGQRVAAVVAMAFVVLSAGGLYWRLGAPALPDAPFSARPAEQADAGAAPSDTEAAHADMRKAAVRLEERLKAEPANAEAWFLYARTESLLGEWGKAADAYKHAIDLGQKNGDILASYGEVLVLAGDGVVSPAAHDAFESSLAMEPGNPAARYYLALADAQAGDEHKAANAWLDLAAGLPEGTPMREDIGRRIAAAAKAGGFDPPSLPPAPPAETPLPGPTPEQMRAAAALPPAERAKMIDGMIEQLAVKLRAEPNNLDGWMRLGRAYFMQGKSDQAMEAYDHAAALRPDDPGIKLQIVAALLAGLHPGDALPARAVSLLKEVAAVAPDAPEVLWYTGVVAARDGRTSEAREKWTKLLASLPPGGQDERMVRGALGQLKGN